MTPAAALLRNRAKLLAACEGLKVSFGGGAGDRDLYIAFRPTPDEARLAKIRKAFAAVIPGVKPHWNGVFFPFVDLRSNRADKYIERIAAAMPRYARARKFAASVVVLKTIESLFLRGKDADIETLIGILDRVATKAAGNPAELTAAIAKLVKPRRLLAYKPGNYAYIPDDWPCEDDGTRMDLVVQIPRTGLIALPDGVVLVQLFRGPSLTTAIRSYTRLPKKRGRTKPLTLAPGKADRSVPDYDALPKAILKLCEQVNPLVPRDAYAAASAAFVKAPKAWSFSGGWPRWLEEPNRKFAKAEFLFQLGSERAVDWGDSGVIHVFATKHGLELSFATA